MKNLICNPLELFRNKLYANTTYFGQITFKLNAAVPHIYIRSLNLTYLHSNVLGIDFRVATATFISSSERSFSISRGSNLTNS